MLLGELTICVVVKTTLVKFLFILSMYFLTIEKRHLHVHWVDTNRKGCY